MAEDFSKSRAAPPAGELRGPRAYEPPPAGWRPGKTSSPLTGERPDSRGPAPPPPRPYPPGAGGLPFPHALPGIPLTHLMQHWVPPGSRAGLYPLPGAPGAHPTAEELLQLERERASMMAQHRQQQAQQQQQPPIPSREAAEKQQREAEKQQREAEKQQREAAERLRQEEERKKQQQAVTQHFAESMRLLKQKQGRLGPTPPGSSAGGLPGLPPAPGGRFADGSAEQERIIRDSIHRLYQSIEPAGHKPEPPAAAAAARPGYPTPDYLSPYYDHMKSAQMHAAKPPQPPSQPQPPPQPAVGGRHSPYLPPGPPGQSSYKPPLSHPPHGRSPAPPEARLPPPPRPVPAHGSERSCSPYLPPAAAPPLPPHRTVYSPPAGLPPPPAAHGGRRTATPPAQHQTLDLSLGSRSGREAGRESPKRPASTPVLNLGVSPAKRVRAEEFQQQPPQLQPQVLSQVPQAQQVPQSLPRTLPQPLSQSIPQTLPQSMPQALPQTLPQPPHQQPPPQPTSRPDEPLSLVSNTARSSASPAPVVRDTWSAPPAPPAPAVISTASTPASGTSSPAPADVAVKVEPVDTRPPSTYTHKLKKKWLQRHAGGDTESTSSSVNGSDAASELPKLVNGNVETAKPAIKVSPPASVKSEPGETEAAASPAPVPVVRSTPSSPPAAPEPKPAVAVNGDGDSESSDSTPPAKRKPAPRRKPPKKAALEIAAAVTPTREAKRQKVSDASETDSEKGSEEEGTPTRDVRKQDAKAAKKRGRRTKEKPAKTPKRPAKPEKKEPSPPKKVEAFKRPSVSKLKKSGASFLQDQSCCELSSKLPKCRECRITQAQRNKKPTNICCRFTAFRRLRYTKSGVLTVAGFCDPEKDAEEEDKRVWLPAERDQSPPPPPPQMQTEVARQLLAHASNQFCDLVSGEQNAARAHMNSDKTVAWKRVVHGYREMCDVCETTLFNVHWVCSKCGFAVCMDCYRGRQEGTARTDSEPGRDRDRFQWMLCSSRQPHDQQRLMLTQIVTGDALTYLGGRVHEARKRAGMPLSCQCETARRLEESDTAAGELANGARHKIEDYDDSDQCDKKGSPLTLLANVALYDSKKNSDASNSESETDGGDKEVDLSRLRNLLLRTTEGGQLQEKLNNKNDRQKTSAGAAALAALDESLEKSSTGQPDSPCQPELKHFVRREAPRPRVPRLPARVMTPSESQRQYPDVRHGWLCEGRLLRLTDSSAEGALRLFRDQWRRGQPVLCSGVGSRLDSALWTPESFSRDFGEEQTETVDCASGVPLPAQPQRHFWEGFGDAAQRPRDGDDQPRVLKLRDWPPGEDFPDIMPARYNDLITALPITDYTRREGRHNLVGCLPECFGPDLGPRLHAVYGSASGPAASASLQHDVSDAVNILAYVAGAEACGDDEQEVQRAVEEAGCDPLTKRRVKEERAGAIWHVYHAADADKIRDLLNKVSVERGEEADPEHDPLLDPSWYLDAPLRRRLHSEYGVSGYAVLQCQGDAVFVPAGAPHQVRHLRSCISATVEFVSAENVGVSFELTQELRAAAVSAAAAAPESGQAAGHDDKRQIKNIMYHAMKEAVWCLQQAGSGGGSPAGAS